MKIVSLFLLFAMSLFAQPLENIYEQLCVTYERIESYEAVFTQYNFWQEADISKISSGKIYYNLHNLLLDYVEPAGQKLIVSDSAVVIYDDVSKQAMISNNDDTAIRPQDILSKYWQNSKKEILNNSEKLQIIKLINSENSQIIVEISEDLIAKITIIDENENSVEYIFSDVKINQKLPKDIFGFQISNDVNVLDTRE